MRVQLIRYHDIGNINTRLAESLNTRQGTLPALGIGYIASSLEKANHEVDLVDCIALGLSADELRARIRSFAPHVVGVTAMTPTFRGAQEASLIAKEEGAITVMGGVHMSIYPKETLSHGYIDFGIAGEGEEAMVKLCDALENKLPVDDIRGLVYKKEGEVHQNGTVIVEDVDSLPWPSYHLLPMEKYSSIIGLHPVSTMMGTRGCPYKCGFCYKTPSDSNIRSRSPKLVVDEMEHLVKKYNVKEIMFYDDIMLPKYTEGLSIEILNRNLNVKWQTPQRVNLVKPGLLKLMKQAGCHLLRFGVEQGDPEMMRLVEKRTTIDRVRQVFRDTSEAKIDTFAYFILGYANETEKTMQATIDLAIDLNPQFVMFTKATPLPRTPLMDTSVVQGLVPEDYWLRFTLGEEMEAIPPLVADADKWVKKAYQSFYFRPSKIANQFLRIRSLKDLQKNVAGFVGLLNFSMAKNAIEKQRHSLMDDLPDDKE